MREMEDQNVEQYLKGALERQAIKTYLLQALRDADTRPTIVTPTVPGLTIQFADGTVWTMPRRKKRKYKPVGTGRRHKGTKANYIIT